MLDIALYPACACEWKMSHFLFECDRLSGVFLNFILLVFRLRFAAIHIVIWINKVTFNWCYKVSSCLLIYAYRLNKRMAWYGIASDGMVCNTTHITSRQLLQWWNFRNNYSLHDFECFCTPRKKKYVQCYAAFVDHWSFSSAFVR